MEGERQKSRADSWGATSKKVMENPPPKICLW